MKFAKKYFCLLAALILAGGFLFSPARAAKYDYDLSLISGDLEFSKDVLISGDTVRIYARIRNVGNKDMTGSVSFFRGAQAIGDSRTISVRPGGYGDVFVDFTIPQDSFNIQAKIQATEPADQNPANDNDQTKLIVPDQDTDHDGIVDRLDPDIDNDGLTNDQEKILGTDPYKADTDGDGSNDKVDAFPLDPKEWLDTDADGIGNNADLDDDNDGLSDVQEKALGTDPLRKDTDGDGVIDSLDAFPLDPARSKVAPARDIFQPVPTSKPETPVNAAATAKNTSAASSTDQINADAQALAALTNSNEAAKKIADQPLEKIGAVVEKVSGASGAFFRLDNLFLWLALGIVLVIGAIVLVILKIKKDRQLPVDAIAKEAPRQAYVHQPAAFKEAGQLLRRSAPNVIDLKDLMNKKR
ncbi:MAG: hypothetical protein NTZ18_01615 [Candidatus Komeilibacteria bacterium]|nr:hypothetical protein [Candidatus Komeilibacteria bacterium]